jgi:hypothetical protein
MSIQMALRPYVTTGIALVGASVIAMTPIAQNQVDLHAAASAPVAQFRDVELAASIDNPFEVFKPVVDSAAGWFSGWITQEMANPFPILKQIVANQQYTVSMLGKSVQGFTNGLNDVVAGLPATWQQMEPLIRAGDINGAINAFMSAGLAPITALLINTWNPLQPALQRVFAVGQSYMSAMFDFSLSLLLGTVDSTLGLGFVIPGQVPFVQQVVTSTQNVLGAIGRLDVVGTINAIQNGIADVALNAIQQLHKFTDVGGTIEYIRNAIINALQTPAPEPPFGPIAASTIPDASATLVSAATLAAPAASASASSGSGSAGESASSTTDSAASTKVDETAPAAVKVDDSGSGAAQADDATAADVKADDTTPSTAAPADTTDSATPATKPARQGASTSVTRDSVRAKPTTRAAAGTRHGSGKPGTAGAESSGATGSDAGGSGSTSSSGDSAA